MSALALTAAASFVLALLLGASSVLAPAAALHVAFAIGILPLIFGAMLHFVPVLTRSGGPHRLVAALPFAAQAVGLVVVLAIAGWLPRWALHPAASAELLLTLALLGWIVRRARRAVGTPHPGWRWYAGALLLLILALAAVPLIVSGSAPAAARLFHLHANTLGFVGLAALGTLPVLLPTVLKRPDAQAAAWLRRRLPLAVAGALLVALGAATAWPLSLVGGAFLVVVAAGLLAHWRAAFGMAAMIADGAAASLLAALGSLLVLLLLGGGHASGAIEARDSVAAYAAAFLLPLVTGALAQLLPVWRFSGMQTPERLEMRRRLARCGRLRAVVLPIGGGAYIAGAPLVGLLGVVLGLGLFAADLFQALRVPPPAR